MKSIGTLCLLLLALASTLAADGTASGDLTGRWDGSVIVLPAQVEVGLTASIRRSADGSWTGTLFSPTHERKELRIEDLLVNGTKVSFLALGDSNVSQFRGELSTDGSILTGEILEGSKRAPFRLHRVAAAAGEHSPVERLAGTLQDLRSAFNADHEKVRLLMILSPGCSDCRMKAFLVQRYVLQQIQDPQLSVYVVWEKVSQGDSYEVAQDVTWSPPDQRERFFWSEDRLAGKIFNKSIGLDGDIAWDVFLVFPAGQSWTEATAPRPDSFMHNLPQSALPKDKIFDVLQLATRLNTLLARQSTPVAKRVN